MSSEIPTFVRHPFDYALGTGIRAVGKNPENMKHFLSHHPRSMRFLVNSLSICRPVGVGFALHMYEHAQRQGDTRKILSATALLAGLISTDVLDGSLSRLASIQDDRPSSIFSGKNIDAVSDTVFRSQLVISSLVPKKDNIMNARFLAEGLMIGPVTLDMLKKKHNSTISGKARTTADGIAIGAHMAYDLLKTTNSAQPNKKIIFLSRTERFARIMAAALASVDAGYRLGGLVFNYKRKK